VPGTRITLTLRLATQTRPPSARSPWSAADGTPLSADGSPPSASAAPPDGADLAGRSDS
jgi:hypothetical protein